MSRTFHFPFMIQPHIGRGEISGGFNFRESYFIEGGNWGFEKTAEKKPKNKEKKPYRWKEMRLCVTAKKKSWGE